MCTSFAAYYGKPLYGMNFDFPKVDIKVTIEKPAQVKFICFYIYVFNKYSPLVGMNEHGNFVNLQELHLDDAVVNSTDSNSANKIDGLELFFDYLNERITIAELMATDCNTQLLLPENYKIHNLFADPNGQATIVEGINGKLLQQKISAHQLVMTNFAHALHPDRSTLDLHYIGAERYLTAYRLIEKARHSLDITKAMAILKNTFQTSGDYPTQCSWVFDPRAQEIYFRLAENIDCIWKLSLLDETIEKTGNKNTSPIKIGDAGVIITKTQL
ncbi:MAG: linear amide hydrolase, choloylglycine hydrolase family [Firmicutes bacterium]|nr:linear amide hydrolase, choloylglycine hydrolase family [Bacillota bacterium]